MKKSVKKRILMWLLVAALVLGTMPAAIATETVVSRSMVVQSVSGDNANMTRGTNLAFPVREGTRLTTGNTVSTGRDSTIDIRMDDNSSVRVNESTKVDISTANRRALTLTVINGTIALNAETQAQGTNTTIRAGNSTMGLRGTLFTVNYSGGELRTILLEGELDIATPDGMFELAAGQVLEYSMHTETDVNALDITQIPDSFTLMLVKEHAEMLVDIGTITPEEVGLLDELIDMRQAEEASRAEAILQGRPDASQQARNLLNAPTAQAQPTPPTDTWDGGGGYTPAPPRPTPPSPEPPSTEPPSKEPPVDEEYSPPVAFAVTYNLNGGSGEIPEQADTVAGEQFKAADASELTPPAGYGRFVEWNTQADGAGSSYAPGAAVTMPDGPLTLYAIWEAYDEGDGTAAAPFRIRTSEDLLKVGQGRAGTYYVLMNNITAPDNFMIVAGGTFVGNFNGNGYAIEVNINLDRDRVGLFSHVCRGGVVENLTVTGTVHGRNQVGGLAGRLCGTVIDSHSYVQVSGDRYIGGLIGFINNDGSVQSSSSTGTVSGNSIVGGLVGFINTRGSVQNSTSAGLVDGSHAGGLYGQNQGTVQ